MKQFQSKYAKFVVSPLIERVTITYKTFDRQKNGQKGFDESYSEYLILYNNLNFCNLKIRNNFLEMNHFSN